jgi:hypothetical protein
MNLQLLITKKEYVHYNNRTRTKHLFAVIDLDESKQYPQNFVSILPLHIRAIVKPSNVFEGLFGNKSLEIANQLLHRALESRTDSETAKAIRKRIKLLATQQNNGAQCQNCGSTIKQSKERDKPYRFCYECHMKAKQKKSYSLEL